MQVQRENAAHFWQSASSRKPQFAGPLDCAMQILRNNGLRGLYRGGVVNFYRDMIGYSFYLPVYQILLRLFHPRTNETVAQVSRGPSLRRLRYWRAA